MQAAIDILEDLERQLPTPHQERAGIIRSIEVLRVELGPQPERKRRLVLEIEIPDVWQADAKSIQHHLFKKGGDEIMDGNISVVRCEIVP